MLVTTLRNFGCIRMSRLRDRRQRRLKTSYGAQLLRAVCTAYLRILRSEMCIIGTMNHKVAIIVRGRIGNRTRTLRIQTAST